jgi:hypothetical protein
MKIANRISVTVTKEDNRLIKYVVRHYKYLILIFILAIIYISNGLIYELEIRKQNNLESELLRARTRYNIRFIEFIEFSSYKNILDRSTQYNLGLEPPSQPPYKVEK